MNQLYVYKYPLFFELPSYLGRHRILSRIPYTIQQALVGYVLRIVVCICQSNLRIHHILLFPLLSVHMTVLYICIPISAMQTSSSIPFF